MGTSFGGYSKMEVLSLSEALMTYANGDASVTATRISSA
jgi:hypothetical protein